MAKGKVLKTIIDIAGEISPTLGKSLDGVADKLESVNLKALGVGAAIGGIAVGTAAAVVKGTKYLADLGDAYNSAVNDISAGTGLVGDELNGMSKVLKDVYGSNFGESMEDAAAGITTVYQATGLTEEALAETTKAAYALSDTFGYDVAESARAAKAMMTNFGISGEEAMSMIAAGAQNGLDYSGELIDTVNEYSVQFSKLGFTADEMFGIFQQGVDSGAWNLDKVGDAVKEFSIRSIDGSKSTTEAYESLGLNAKKMMQLFANGGDDASEAFGTVVKSLMNVDDAVKRDAIGVQLFGTQWEDLGVDAVAALANVQDGAYDTGNALEQINKVKYNNIGDAIEGIKREAEVSLLPLASTIANAFMQIAPILGDLFEELGPIIEQTTQDIMPFVSEFLAGAVDVLQDLLPFISELARSLLPILSTFVKQLLPPILKLIQQILPPLMQIVEAVLPALSEILLSVLPIVSELISAILPVIVSLISQLLPLLMPLLDLALMLVEKVVMPLLEPLLMLAESLLPIIVPFIEVLVKLLEPLLKILEPIADVLGVIIGWISEIVGWVADGLTWVVDLIFGDTDDVAATAKANGYATGGFTDGVSIAGEDPRYPMEAVISFNPAYRAQNLSYWAQAGRMLGADSADFALGGASGDTSIIDFGGITFAPHIEITGQADKKTIMDAIEDEYPEFIDFLEEWLAGRGKPVYG